MVITEKEVFSFERELYNLEEGIKHFEKKVYKCNMSGLIDIAHKIELDIDSLDKQLSGFVKFEKHAVEEIRNKRLGINLDKLKQQYNIDKNAIDDLCECRNRIS